jgi:hypothetical protein
MAFDLGIRHSLQHQAGHAKWGDKLIEGTDGDGSRNLQSSTNPSWNEESKKDDPRTQVGMKNPKRMRSSDDCKGNFQKKYCSNPG